MNTTIRSPIGGLALLSALLIILQPSSLCAQGTAFTYQGRLDVGGAPASGSYDLRFTLHDAASGGNQWGSALTNSAVAASNGLFTTTLDFGFGVLNGNPRWLEIAVRTNGSGAFMTLSPRQQLTATPYAILAGNISGVLANSSLPANPSFTGTVSGAGFSGNGGGLTNLNASQLSSGTVPAAALGNAWTINGNSGTTPGTDFLGTTDNQPVEVRVNNQRALRLEPTTSGPPNVIAGLAANRVETGMAGATISGGGAPDNPNVVSNHFGTIGGGTFNRASGVWATIAGGRDNFTAGDYTAVGGGWGNLASNSYATVGGGRGNLAQGQATTVSGGTANAARGDFATVSGGATNTALGWWTTVSGGRENFVHDAYSTVGGGYRNQAPIGNYVSMGGGRENLAQGHYTTVAGGQRNNAGGLLMAHGATVGGGENNTAANYYATVGGGLGNIANGWYSTVCGGLSNSASSEASFAAGNKAQALHGFSFVWSSYQNPSPSFADYTFFVNAPNGLGVNCGPQRPDGGGQYWMNLGRVAAGGQLIETSVGATLTLSGVWQNASDQHRKTDFEAVDVGAVLQKVLALPVRQWRFTNELAGVKHLGPTAQDFHAAFGLGEDDRSIGTVDADGVALAAIQGLNQKLEDTRAENAALKQRLAQLEELVRTLAARGNGGGQ